MASFAVDVVLKARDEASPVVKQLVGLTRQLANRRRGLVKATNEATKATRALAIATVRSNAALEAAVPGLGKLTAETRELGAATRSLGIARRGVLGDTRQLAVATNKLAEASRRAATAGGRGRSSSGAGLGPVFGPATPTFHSNRAYGKRPGLGPMLGPAKPPPVPVRDPWDFRQHRIAEALGGASANIGRLGQQARTAVQAPLELAMGFEQAITEVRAVTGDAKVGGNFEALRDAAREIGRTTEFTATDAAKALKLLGMAGMDTSKQLATLRPLMDAATVGGDSLEKTASNLNGVMGSFGIKADSVINGVSGAAFAMDSLTAANMASDTTLSELSRAMFKAAPVASTLGVEFNELATFAAVLANAGIKGSQAGTAMRNMMLSLTGKPTKDLRQMLAALGLDANELRTHLGKHGLASTMRLLMTQMEGLDEGTRVLASNVLFGRYTTAPALKAMQALGKDYDEIRAKVDASRGSAAQVAGEYRSTSLAGVKTLRSALEEMGITIGEELLPVVKPLIKDATELAKSFAAWAKENPALVQTLGKTLMHMAVFGAVAAPVLLTLSSITSVLTLGKTAWALFGGSAAKAATQAAGATGRFAALSRAATMATGPLVAFMAAWWAAEKIIDVAQNKIEKQTDDSVGFSKKLTGAAPKVAAEATDEGLASLIASEEKRAAQFEANAAKAMAERGLVGNLFNRGRNAAAEHAEESRMRLVEYRNEQARRREAAKQPKPEDTPKSARQKAAEERLAELDRQRAELLVRVQDDRTTVEHVNGDHLAVEQGIYPGGM